MQPFEKSNVLNYFSETDNDGINILNLGAVRMYSMPEVEGGIRDDLKVYLADPNNFGPYGSKILFETTVGELSAYIGGGGSDPIVTGTFDTNIQGPFNPDPVSFEYKLFANQVILNLPEFLLPAPVGPNPITFTDNLPAGLIPLNDVAVPLFVLDNNVQYIGYILITPTGVVTIYREPNQTPFDGGATTGIYSSGISYKVS